jgi:hypothetical protein
MIFSRCHHNAKSCVTFVSYSRSVMMKCSSLLPLTVALAACGAGNDTPDDASDNCVADPRGEPFSIGISKLGRDNRLTFSIMAATPAPPARGDNNWTIAVSNSSGAVVGATVTAKPFMPDHRHGSAITAVVTPQATTPGQYDITPVNLWMPGIWETTITATPPGGTLDVAVFSFCIPR